MAPSERIVVGLDGSPSSAAAAAWAGTQAERSGASLDMVTVWQWPTSYGWPMPIPDDYDPAADAEKVLGQAADELRRQHPGVAIATRVEEGHPAEVLLAVSRGADLLVVGSRGHGAFAGMLLGSVSEHCVAHADCPVVVVRAPRDVTT